MKNKIIVVAGARPNFMKIAPLMREFKKHKKLFQVKLVHTGQHYDSKMSDIFFKELEISKPHIYLGVGSGSHAEQTAKVMTAFEKILLKEKPELIIVVGDVNSTMACSLVAVKLNIKVAHVEAGLRSFDRTMPEEINRIITDSLSDYLFVSENSGILNLKKEGIPLNKIHFVGNIMIDTLLFNLNKAKKSMILERIAGQIKDKSLRAKDYALLTLHRPSNVDEKKALVEIYDIIEAVAKKIKIIYPLHPRTKKMLNKHKFLNKFKRLDNFLIIEPVGYKDNIQLMKNAKFVMTDSGGVQEETTVLGVPCLTIRENTERPVTISQGTNVLVGRNKIKIVREVNKIFKGVSSKNNVPKFWDGKTAQRIVSILVSKYR